jgi:hypothetical protein
MSYTDVFLIRYVGQPYIYAGTDPISDTSLFNPASVATFGGKAAWPTRHGFQLYSGGFTSSRSRVPSRRDTGHGIRRRPGDCDGPDWGPFRMHGATTSASPKSGGSTRASATRVQPLRHLGLRAELLGVGRARPQRHGPGRRLPVPLHGRRRRARLRARVRHARERREPRRQRVPGERHAGPRLQRPAPSTSTAC